MIKKLFLTSPLKYIILAILINLLLFTIFFCSITPRYQTNDDNSMEAIASGNRTGQPSEYLIFINVLIGKILVFFYNNFLNINWYPVLFYLLHFLSMTVICYCLILKKGFAFGLAFFLLIFTFFELFMLANLQYTTTASVTAISGVLLFLTHWDSKGYKLYIAMAASIFLFLFSALIRESMAYLLLLLFLVLLLFKFIKKPSLTIPIFIIIATILFASSYFYNIKYYQKDPQWKFYVQYNRLRSKILDYSQFSFNDETKDVYKTVGWSENDVKMYRSWFFNDLEIYSVEKLQYVVNNINDHNGTGETFNELKKSFNSIDSKTKVFFLFFLIFLIPAMIKKRNKYLLLILIPTIAASLYFSYAGRLPDRVFIPIIFYATIASIHFTRPVDLTFLSNSGRKVLQISTVIVCVAIAISVFATTSFTSRINSIKQKEFEITIDNMKKEGGLYVRWGAVPLHDRKVFFYTPESLKGLKYIQQGWSMHSPIYNEILERYSIENIYLDIIERDDIYVLCSKEQANIFKIFMKEHYSLAVKSNRISRFEGSSFITRFYIP